MGYEIREDRVITRDGGAVEPESRYVAKLHGPSDPVTMFIEDGWLCIEPSRFGEQRDTNMNIGDFLCAIGDLSRLSGNYAEASALSDGLRERAARVVERSCSMLTDRQPETRDVRQTVAAELRVIMLELIDLAARPVLIAGISGRRESADD